MPRARSSARSPSRSPARSCSRGISVRRADAKGVVPLESRGAAILYFHLVAADLPDDRARRRRRHLARRPGLGPADLLRAAECGTVAGRGHGLGERFRRRGIAHRRSTVPRGPESGTASGPRSAIRPRPKPSGARWTGSSSPRSPAPPGCGTCVEDVGPSTGPSSKAEDPTRLLSWGHGEDGRARAAGRLPGACSGPLGGGCGGRGGSHARSARRRGSPRDPGRRVDDDGEAGSCLRAGRARSGSEPATACRSSARARG